jgi:hypothetical protein
MSETQDSNNQSSQELLLGMALGYMLARAVHVTAEMGIAGAGRDLSGDRAARRTLAINPAARNRALMRL